MECVTFLLTVISFAMNTVPTEHQEVLPTGYCLRDYVIDRVLSRGGFSITYLATESLTGYKVVIKENYPALYVEREIGTLAVRSRPDSESIYDWAKSNFVKEARILRSLPPHVNIMGVHAIFAENGTNYMVLPYVEGTGVEKFCPPSTSLPESLLLPLLRKLLTALEFLHEHGIVHRDVKPSNIILQPDGEPALIDFGVACFFGAEQCVTPVGTYGYAPPEQIAQNNSEQHPHPSQDLYALGATCYRLITGRIPGYEPDNLVDDAELCSRYSRPFLEMIDRARSLNPAERWQSARDWLAALQQPQA